MNEPTTTSATSHFPEAAGRSLRVAVSSTTGRLVDSHFGKANDFIIYEVNATEIRLLETRSLEYEDGPPDGGSRPAKRADLIADCDAVVTSRVGPAAKDLLDERGILLVEYTYQIEKGLRYAFQEWQVREARRASEQATNS